MSDTIAEKSPYQADVSTEEDSDREGDETGRLLRATVDELQKALIESRTLLSERDTELSKLRNELEQHRKQVSHSARAGLMMLCLQCLGLEQNV